MLYMCTFFKGFLYNHSVESLILGMALQAAEGEDASVVDDLRSWILFYFFFCFKIYNYHFLKKYFVFYFHLKLLYSSLHFVYFLFWNFHLQKRMFHFKIQITVSLCFNNNHISQFMMKYSKFSLIKCIFITFSYHSFYDHKLYNFNLCNIETKFFKKR